MGVGFWSLSRSLAVSPQVTIAINPAVDCHYFPPGLRLPPQSPSKLRCLVTEAQACKQLDQGCTRQCGGRDLNTQPVDRKSGTLTTRPLSHTMGRVSNQNNPNTRSLTVHADMSKPCQYCQGTESTVFCCH